MRECQCHTICTFWFYDRTEKESRPGRASRKADPVQAAGNSWHRPGQLQIAPAFLRPHSPNCEHGLFTHLFSFVFLTRAPMLPKCTSRCGFNETYESLYHTVVNGASHWGTSQIRFMVEAVGNTDIPGKGRQVHSFWYSRSSASDPEGFTLSLPELWPTLKEPRI